ncbi:DNA methylase N-4 [Flavobacterium lutivivi]|nr:DNA methylase N-4 [Flavobacterium lutivivi]
MEKINSLTSADIVADNIELLKQLFPTIVKEGNIDLNELKALLGETVEEKEEYYRFTWAGKNQARLEANKPTTATLRPNKKESKNWDTTNNIFIEGDNLEVLKLLQKSYANKIKMIYIDPPYNTGKDFVYKDNYADNLGNYLNITNQTDEQGKKTSTNTESDGRYHSNWLNMMYPRLRLARNLMTDDGVIFISIDDNEVHNLRKACDEVFGEDNFVANIIWEKKYSPQNDAKWFSPNHDHIILYAKNKNNYRPVLLQRNEEQLARYKNPDNDPRGVWKMSDLSVKTYSPDYDYPIVTPSGRIAKLPAGRCWMTNETKMKELIADNRIWFGEEGNNIPALKRFLTDVKDGVTPMTIWNRKDVGDNQEGKQELIKIMPENVFQTPKVVRLIKKMINLTFNTSDILLDFFAGSGTTAHAVMQLNAEDGGDRKCISVQLPEPTDDKSEAFKAGYKTIAEITKERIRRAGEKIKNDYKDNKEVINKLDVGFKAFKLDSSNIQAWDGNPDNLEEQLDIFANNIKTDRTEEDILFEILLKYGLDLTVAIDEKTIAAQKVFSVGQGTLFICLSNAISPAVSEGIGAWKQELNPTICRVIFKDTGFQSDKDKTNAMQILKRFGIEEVNSI